MDLLDKPIRTSKCEQLDKQTKGIKAIARELDEAGTILKFYD